MATLLSTANLAALLRSAMERRYRVAGPRKEKHLVLFAELGAPEELCLDVLATKNSAKEFVFPTCEKLFEFKLGQKDVTLSEVLETQPTILVGTRACDARALLRMDRLFGWDYRDNFYFKRREATALITIACDRYDEACFCTSLGFTPRSPEASDIMLVPLAGRDDYRAEAVSERGKALMKEFAGCFTEGEAGPDTVVEPPVKFDLARIRPWLEKNFDSPLWKTDFLACMGCATCAFLCPTCHCFDIVDEGDRSCGARYKTWDTCQFAQFTAHTSGHNPRPSQDARWRQRLRHKFLYYVEKFGGEACVGCGRCIRNCPACLNILDELVKIDALASAEAGAAAAPAPAAKG